MAGRGCRQSGFTTVELMVTMVIAAIMMAIAIPVLNTPKTTAESNALLGALRFARSSAIKLGQSVIVCPSTNPMAATPVCATNANSWSTGWIVLAVANTTAPGAAVAAPCTPTGAGDLVLQVQQALTSGDSANFVATGANTNNDFCFVRNGFSYAGFLGEVTFDTNPSKMAQRRCTMVSGVGHLQVLRHAQSDATGAACP